LIIGLILGSILGICFKKCQERINLKLFFLVLNLCLIVTAVELSGFSQALYICVLFHGYALNLFWNKDKPDKLLAKIWKYISPFLFGTIGAAIKISKLKPGVIPKAFTIILIGLIARLLVTYLWVWQKKYTIKERIVIVCSWIPKATVQAAIGSVVLDKTRKEIEANSPDREDYEDYGNFFLTTAVMSILLTAPIGAVLTNSLGIKWLNRTEGSAFILIIETSASDSNNKIEADKSSKQIDSK
jgi:solute carrier family 9B (sodium/hydrogen exchanger), member 1/2